MIAADDQQLLARRIIPLWRVIVHAAIARIHAVDESVTKGPLLWMTLPHMARMRSPAVEMPTSFQPEQRVFQGHQLDRWWCATRRNARTGTPPRFGTFIPDKGDIRITRSLEPPNGCNVIGEIPS
jgi:hypothetical protein